MIRRRRTERIWVPDPAWLRPDWEGQGERIGARFMLLATALAVAVRLYHLGFQSFWVDEAMTWAMVRPGAGLTFGRQLLDEIQGPLYLAAVWPLARWFGFSEFWLRLPAALAGALTVPVLALLGQRLFGGRTARLAALVLAVSPFHLWYSQEARGYSFLMLLATASTLAFLLLADRPTRSRAALYAVLATGVVLSNLSGLFLLGGHAAAAALVVRPRGASARWLWLGAFAAVVVMTAPWLLKASGILAVDRLLPGVGSGTALRGETTFTPLALPFTLFAFFFGYSLGPSLTELHLPDRLAVVRAHWPLLAAAAAATGVVMTAGVLRLRRRTGALALAWLGVPLAAVVILALRNVKPFNPRYLAAVFPLILLVAAHGMASLPRRLGRLCGFVLLGLFFWSLWGYHADGRYAKEDLRGAAVWIAGRSEPGDVVLVPVVTNAYGLYHEGPGRIVPFWNVQPLATVAEAEDAMNVRRGGARRGFLLLSRAWEIDPRGLLPQALASVAVIEAEARFPGVRVFAWRMPARGEGAS